MTKIVFLKALFLLVIFRIEATTFTVSNLNDSGSGSLRQAIISANADASATSGSPHIIDATSMTGSISLESALPALSQHITINGPSDNSLTISRGVSTAFRIFYINSGQSVTINNLNISGGVGTGDAPSYMQHGSGIQNHGSLNLNYCEILNCKMPNGGYGFGGALYNSSTSSSVISNCIFSSSYSTNGGALAYEGGTHTLTNSTINGNKANQNGGGIYAKSGTITVKNCTFSADSSMNFSKGSAIYVDGSSVGVFNSTFAYNYASYTGTIAQLSGTLQLSNSILVGNAFGSSTLSDLSGTVSSLYGHNIFGTQVTISGNTNNSMDVAANNVISSNLLTNGAFSPTYSLVSCGYAINNGTILGSLSTDQRGISRVDSVDIGAFEDNTGLNGSPTILQNISSLTVCSGAPIDFSVGVTQSNSYQWEVNTGTGMFTAITDAGVYSGSATSHLSISSTNGMNAYQFRCVITNTNCSIVLYSNTATLTTIGSPSITSDLPLESYGCSGSNTNMNIYASGGNSLTYQWQIDQGAGFTNLSNGSPYSGVSSSTLTILSNTGLEGYLYRVLVSNECGGDPVASTSSILKISTTLSVSAHPLNQTICSGGTTTFSVTASGINNYYEWQYNTGSGGYIPVTNGTYYADVTTSTLTFKQAPAAFNGYNFKCKISNACNWSGIYSNAATVTIVAPDYSIISHPSDQIFCSGGNASFSVNTSGGSVNYQWQVDQGSGFANVANDATYSNVTSSTLSISGISSGMSGYLYRCAMSSSVCSNVQYSNPASLTFDGVFAISTQPDPIIACENAAVGFSVSANGSSLSYQWQVDDGSGFTDVVNDGTYNGINSSSIAISPVSISKSGYIYRCIITNTCNSTITSSNASLTVNPSAQIATHPSNQIVWTNGQTTFSASGTGINVTYTWQVNSGSGFSNLSDNGTYSGSNTSTLTLSSATSAMNSYSYRCLVSSSCGSINSNSASLIVLQPSICMVTVDDVTGKNMVVFEKLSGNSLVDSFRVYKEGSITNQFIQIGRLGKNELSSFVDVSSAPTQNADIYKIAIKDINGNLTPLSLPHKTMHLTINQGINNTWNLIWSAYSGVSVSTYNIYRGTNSSNMTQIASLSGSNTSYTDNTPPLVSNLYYQIEIVGTACNPTAKLSTLSSIKSNLAETQNATTSITNGSLDSQIKIYPNPAKGKITITGIEPSYHIAVYDITGQELKINHEEGNINTEGWPTGVYIMEISLDGATARKKLVIEP